MLRIPCPYCGLRDQTEFSYGGDATLVRPAMDETDMDVWHSYVFLRENPKGPHLELWHHASGCRAWLRVERDVVTHEITTATPARDGIPPRYRTDPAKVEVSK